MEGLSWVGATAGRAGCGTQVMIPVFEILTQKGRSLRDPIYDSVSHVRFERRPGLFQVGIAGDLVKPFLLRHRSCRPVVCVFADQIVIRCAPRSPEFVEVTRNGGDSGSDQGKGLGVRLQAVVRIQAHDCANVAVQDARLRIGGGRIFFEPEVPRLVHE